MIPEHIQAKAQEVLGQYEAREIRAKTFYYNKKLKALNVGRRWRLINRGNGWQLVSHEDYNRLIKR